MILNDLGRIACNEWYISFNLHQELFLDAFVLMPNHLHAIVVISNPNKDSFDNNDLKNGGGSDGGGSDPNNPFQTQNSSANLNPYRPLWRDINQLC